MPRRVVTVLVAMALAGCAGQRRVIEDLPGPVMPPVVAEPLPPPPPPPSGKPRSIGPVTIIVDAGHGGQDPGTRGVSPVYEKVVNLAIVQELIRMLAEREAHVTATRTSDTYVSLPSRSLLADRTRADLFVSIHSDYARRSSASGATLYIGRRNSPASTRAADCVFAALRSAGIKCNGIRRKDFHVLVDHSRPAVLIECGYMSNRGDSGRLNDPTYRTQLAEAITNGIARYFGK